MLGFPNPLSKKTLPNKTPNMADEDFTVEETPGYKAPAKAGLEEMQNKDADDEALNRWKAKLLEGQAAKTDDPRLVIPMEFQFLVEGRDDIIIDLTKGAEELKEQCIVLKESSEFKLGIKFK